MNPSRAALALLLLPSLLRAADPDFSAAIGDQRRMAKESMAAAKAAAAAPPPVVVSGVDMSDFLRRLEDMTLDTTVLRGLLGQIGVSFRGEGDSADAQYGQIRNVMYLPASVKAKGRSAIRYDLDSSQINTIIHELTHASADKLASSDAPAGSAGAEHYKALRMISAQVRDGSLLARYPNTKADELAGYYMGCAIQDLEDVRRNLVMHSANSPVADQAEADRLGGTVLTFDEKGGAPHAQPAHETFRTMMNAPLGQCSILERAEFNHSKIGVEPDWLSKNVLYQNALGLKPPLSIRELVARLNDPARNGPGLQAMRAEIRKGRAFQLSRRR